MSTATLKRIDRSWIRWMVRADLPRVLEIESQCFGADAWSEDDFMRCNRRITVIPYVIEVDDRVVGYVVPESSKLRYDILNIAVAPDFMRRGIGRRLIDKLKRGLLGTNKSRLDAIVNERNLAAQLFFRSMGFRCKHIAPGYWDGDEAAYCFIFRDGGQQ